jgi:hypothetical protein
MGTLKRRARGLQNTLRSSSDITAGHETHLGPTRHRHQDHIRYRGVDMSALEQAYNQIDLSRLESLKSQGAQQP